MVGLWLGLVFRVFELRPQRTCLELLLRILGSGRASIQSLKAYERGRAEGLGWV